MPTNIDTVSHMTIDTEVNGSAQDFNTKKLLNEDMNNYAYSKKSHLGIFKDFFSKNQITKDIPYENIHNIKDYQNLLVIYLIKYLLPKNSRILCIGKESYNILKCLESDYQCYEMESLDMLCSDLINSPELIYVNKIDDSENKLTDSHDFFDFVFSITGLENINSKHTFKEQSNIIYNLNWLTKAGGYINIHFSVLFKGGIEIFNPLLYNLHKDLFKNNQAVIDYHSFSSIRIDCDLLNFLEIQNDSSNNEDILSDKEENLFSYNILISKNHTAIALKTVLSPVEYLKKRPAYFFHHLIKCGGSSLGVVMRKWFNFNNDFYDKVGGSLGFDYGGDVNFYRKYKFNLEYITSDTCIRGHFQHEGIYLHQRYPEIFDRKDEIKIFTFVRDPFKMLVSLYYFARLRGYNYQNISLETFLKTTNNFMAYLLPCDESNYKEILDKYFFIGIVEKMQESFDKLADLTGMKRLNVPRYNTTDKDEQVAQLSKEFILDVKKMNSLDYKIYNYCLEKFNKM